MVYIARLYWFTVEFGLIRTRAGLRIYGSGIVSSKGESVFCLESKRPNRLAFDLMRIMQSYYDYDDFQKTYFVIDNYEQRSRQLRRISRPIARNCVAASRSRLARFCRSIA